MILSGDTAGIAYPRYDPAINADNYLIGYGTGGNLGLNWYWYPDWDQCTLNSGFEFASPTRFSVAYITPPVPPGKR